MRPTIIQDFEFKWVGYGHYKVTYTSPKTGKQWSVLTSDMHLIDATRNANTPLIRDLNILKSICKRGSAK